MKRITTLLTAILMATVFASAISLAYDFSFAGTLVTVLALGALVPSMSGTLTMAITPDHVLWADGQDNMGSIRTTVYFSPISAFNSIKTIPANPTTFAESVTIATTHTFTSGAGGFLKLYCTEDTGMVEDEGVGEKDGKSFRNKLKVFVPGGQKKAAGFAKYINNTGCMFIARDAEGRYRQVGTEQYPAKIDSGTMTTTETADGRKGYTMEVSCASTSPAPYYEGTVTEDSSSLS